MSCGCGGGCAGCQGFSYAVGIHQPWVCNQFGQIPPTLPCPPSNALAGCSLRDANLACIANQISEAWFNLQTSLVGQTAQLDVLNTQRPLLITEMKENKEYTCDVEEIFNRDETVSNILNAISTSVKLLEDEDNYSTINGYLQQVIQYVNNYFQMVSTWM